MSYTPMQRANAFIQTGELRDALEALTEQLAAQPDDDSARRLRINVQMRLADETSLRQALDDSAALTTRQPTDDLHESIVYEKLGDLAGAIDAMQRAYDAAANDERYAERLMTLQQAIGDYDAALALVRQQPRSWRWLEREADILVLQGDDTTATACYGLVLAKLDEFEGVLREDYRQSLRSRVLLARANAFRRAGQLSLAAEHYEQAAQLQPNEPTIPFNRGLLHALDDNLEAAADACNAGLAAASPTLREQMLASLDDDPAFASLRQRLTSN